MQKKGGCVKVEVHKGGCRWSRSLVTRWSRIVTTYAMALVACALAAGVVSVVYTAHHLELLTGRNDLISTQKRYLQLDDAYSRAFHGLDQLIVVAEGPDEDDTKAFVRRLAERLQADHDHVQEVFYRVDSSSLDGKKLLLLSPQDLHTLHENVEERRELIQEVTTAPGLNPLLTAINHTVSSAMVSHLAGGFLGIAEPEEKTDKKPLNLTFLHSLLEQMDQTLVASGFRYRSPWQAFLGEDELDNDGFLVSDDHRFVFLLVEPQTQEEGLTDHEAVIDVIRTAIAELKTAFPQVQAGVTGDAVLGNDEMLAAQADTGTATVLSLTGVTLLYLLFFRNVRRPLLIVLTVLTGLAWTIGLFTFTIGHVSILSIFVAPILIGLCDAYGVYFTTRYEEERDHGQPLSAALEQTFVSTVPSLAAGAGTTALAFFAMTLADFRGVQELGFFAGTGVLLLLLAALTVLPALLTLTEHEQQWRTSVRRETVVARGFVCWGRTLQRYRRLILILTTMVSLLCVWALPTLTFDYNLLHLQARGTESVTWELRILQNAGRSSWYALASASSLAEAAQKAAQFAALPTVEHVETIASLVPTDQEERLRLIYELGQLFTGLPKKLLPAGAVDVPELRHTLESIRFKLQSANDAWDPQAKPEERELADVQATLARLLVHLETVPAPHVAAALERLQESLFRDFMDTWSLLRTNLQPAGPITLTDVPAQLRSRFVSTDGALFLLQIYPRTDIWEGGPLREFVSQLRQVDPDVTGNPVIGYESIHAIRDGYVKGGLYAAAIIPLVTFLALRRVSDTLRALLPVAYGMLWTAGLMWLCHLQFNLANMVAIPLIIGVGVDGGINLIRRAREEERDGWALIGGSTGQAIALYSLDSIAGFSSLMVAQHYGIFSMGLLLALAVGSVLLATLTVLPLLLHPSGPPVMPTQHSRATMGEETLQFTCTAAKRAVH